MGLVTSLHYFGENGMEQGHVFLAAEEETWCEHLVSGEEWGLSPPLPGPCLRNSRGPPLGRPSGYVFSLGHGSGE